MVNNTAHSISCPGVLDNHFGRKQSSFRPTQQQQQQIHKACVDITVGRMELSRNTKRCCTIDMIILMIYIGSWVSEPKRSLEFYGCLKIPHFKFLTTSNVQHSNSFPSTFPQLHLPPPLTPSCNWDQVTIILTEENDIYEQCCTVIHTVIIKCCCWESLYQLNILSQDNSP